MWVKERVGYVNLPNVFGGNCLDVDLSDDLITEIEHLKMIRIQGGSKK